MANSSYSKNTKCLRLSKYLQMKVQGLRVLFNDAMTCETCDGWNNSLKTTDLLGKWGMMFLLAILHFCFLETILLIFLFCLPGIVASVALFGGGCLEVQSAPCHYRQSPYGEVRRCTHCNECSTRILVSQVIPRRRTQCKRRLHGRAQANSIHSKKLGVNNHMEQRSRRHGSKTSQSAAFVTKSVHLADLL